MNISNVEGGGIERGAERIARLQPQPPAGSRKAAGDAASISENAGRAAAAAEELAARARAEDPAREALVEAARLRLENGGLDADAVLRETAARVIESGYLAQ